MFVVINIKPGDTLNELMAFMTQKTITFSVTDQLSRLCDRSEKKEISTQTEDSCFDSPPNKKLKVYKEEDYGSPCSSATPSEPFELAALSKTNGNGQWDGESTVLRGLIKYENDQLLNGNKQDEAEDASVEDEISTEYMQNQLMQALFPKSENGVINGFSPEDNESLDGESVVLSDLQGAFRMDGSPASAIRYKPAYASTKRGVCHVCNREVSLITTHRRRHAITHLGFKTLKCALCYKFFSRQDLATGHFKKDHPNAEFTPFVDTMSEEDERQLVVMMGMCFPEETGTRKRKDGDPKKQKAAEC
uniref:C2H2-type domain-containing protein n=1 Tax=Caenorhabditis tropicalis TaxID=1561998 RepID=A0A1I7T2E8_9PELO